MEKNYVSPEMDSVAAVSDAGIAARECDCASDFIERYEVGDDKDDETAGF